MPSGVLFVSSPIDSESDANKNFFPSNARSSSSSSSTSNPAHQQIDLFESILRDGEQGARRTLTPDQKGAFARTLEEDVGVSIIDAGLPGASPLDFAGVQSVVRNTRDATLSVLSHGTPAEIKLAARALRGAEERSRISTFHRPMELSTRHRHNSGSNIRRRILKNVRKAVSVASDLAPEVQYYLVYAGNRDPDFLAAMAHEGASAGATHVVLADSQSALTPTRTHRLTMGIKKALRDDGRCQLSVHCHNQMGLALPNTLAAISAGATQVESCLLGIGDAGGNLATEQFLAYCEHFSSQQPIEDDELFPASWSVPGICLPSAVTLANDVAKAMRFGIGENQPIIGARSFTCTTGIHQDNLDHLGHTGFQAKQAGRSWKFGLNRHSSQKAVHNLLANHPEWFVRGNTTAIDGTLLGGMSDAVYSYLSQRVDVMSETEVRSFVDQMLEAYDVLQNRGVLICPTTVGYTLVTTRNAAKMKSLKGRPDDKPCGILGTHEVFRATFGTEPPLPSDRFTRYTVGYLGMPQASRSDESSPRFLTRDAMGPRGEVGIWLELGPVIEYLASRLWSERREILVATSCNRAGEGNPRSDRFDLACVDPAVRSGVDFEVAIPHWGTPQLDGDGRWLSAPIWDMEHARFIRKGRDQDIIARLLQPEKQQQPANATTMYPKIEIPVAKAIENSDSLNSTRTLLKVD